MISRLYFDWLKAPAPSRRVGRVPIWSTHATPAFRHVKLTHHWPPQPGV